MNLFPAPAPNCLCPTGPTSWSVTLFSNRTSPNILPLCKIMFPGSLHPLTTTTINTCNNKRQIQTQAIILRHKIQAPPSLTSLTIGVIRVIGPGNQTLMLLWLMSFVRTLYVLFSPLYRIYFYKYKIFNIRVLFTPLMKFGNKWETDKMPINTDNCLQN